MRPTQVIYILRKLRTTLAGEGEHQAAQALEIAAQAVEREQNSERLQQSGRRELMPVARMRGPAVVGAPRLGGIADHIAAKRASGGINV